jgi:hypothetical protein
MSSDVTIGRSRDDTNPLRPLLPGSRHERPSGRTAFLKKAAQQGDVRAMCQLGLECREANRRRSWFQQAAHQGHAVGMYLLSLELDGPEQVHWLRKAAEKGHLEAMYHLGFLCVDPDEREHWLAEAERIRCQADTET